MQSEKHDIGIVGGGIIGLAVAMALLERFHASVIVFEAADRLAAHQSGHNSGVIHAGLYYKPGSLKARLCASGRESMFRFCGERGIPHVRCGKIVVATHADQLDRLRVLEDRGGRNGLTGIRRLGPAQLREIEPHATGVEGLFIPQTGVVDYARVTEAYGEVIREQGGEVKLRAPVHGIARDGGSLRVLAGEREYSIGNLVNCAGARADRVARLAGVDPGVRIIPFRGQYLTLEDRGRELIRGLIYPVPDPRYPFLGVHLHRTIDGVIEAGPNAILALSRDGYEFSDVDPADVAEMLLYPGFWRMALANWRTGIDEVRRSLSIEAFVRDAQRLVPAVTASDFRPGRAGVRAQAVDRNGALVDDFRIVQTGQMTHVLNAPSPAATASIAIGRSIAAMITPHAPLTRRAAVSESVEAATVSWL